ncbi:MAG: hypothetical protein WAS21_27230 [Geminicoccaceae bacterium]
MSLQETNLYLLQCWHWSYQVGREAVLPLFGLTDDDIKTLLDADETTQRCWAGGPLALVQPLPGLLKALRDNKYPRVLSYIGRARQLAVNDMVARMAQPANARLLKAWQQALGNDRLALAFSLDAVDLAALNGASEADLTDWSHLPLAVATPRPGLLPAMRRPDPHRLVAYRPWVGEP